MDAFASTYLEQVSNEPDPLRRREAIERLFHPQVRYIDQDGPVQGREAFIARIDFLASLMQPGHRFVLLGPAAVVAEAVLFRWELGLPGQFVAVSGTNAAVVEGDTVVHMYAVND